MKKIYNPKVVRMMNQIHREKGHLILMWIPGHTGASREIKRPTNTLKRHCNCKGKPTRTTKPLQKTGKTG
jgi:hypothetical protein